MYSVDADKKFPFLFSLREHFQSRMCSGDLPMSHSQEYYSWAFNVLMNQDLMGHSVRMVARRGFELLCEDRNIARGETTTTFDEIGSKKAIKELASMQRKDTWSLFCTITCNQRGSPGVQELVESLVASLPNPGPTNREAENIINAHVALISRAFHRYVHHFLQYIETSPDRPLGEVKYLWGRMEFQDGGKGNLPHLHFGVTVKNETRAQLAQRIFCDRQDFAVPGVTDFNTLLRDGLVTDWQDYMHLLEQLKFQVHDCSKAKGKCLKRTGSDGQPVCRVPTILKVAIPGMSILRNSTPRTSLMYLRK
jgi:hypothetical protein